MNFLLILDCKKNDSTHEINILISPVIKKFSYNF